MDSQARIRTTKWQVSPTFSRSSYLVQHSELEHLKRVQDFFSLEFSLKNGNTTNEQVLSVIVIQDIHIYMVLLKGILFLFSLKRTKAAL